MDAPAAAGASARSLRLGRSAPTGRRCAPARAERAGQVTGRPLSRGVRSVSTVTRPRQSFSCAGSRAGKWNLQAPSPQFPVRDRRPPPTPSRITSSRVETMSRRVCRHAERLLPGASRDRRGPRRSRRHRGLRHLYEQPIRRASGGWLYAGAYPELLTGEDGHSLGVADAPVKDQGPNYALVKRLQRWRSIEHGCATGPILPRGAPTWTASVTKNRLLAAGVHDSHNSPTDGHPARRVAHGAVHGGYWRRPYEIRLHPGVHRGPRPRSRPPSDPQVRLDPSALAGKLVKLRPVKDSDLDTLSAWFGDREFVEWWRGDALSQDEVRARYLGRREGITSFVVTERGEPVGYAQWWAQDAGQGGIDLVLAPEAQGRGLGVDAAEALVQHLFDELGWHGLPWTPTHATPGRCERGGRRASTRSSGRALR